MKLTSMLLVTNIEVAGNVQEVRNIALYTLGVRVLTRDYRSLQEPMRDLKLRGNRGKQHLR